MQATWLLLLLLLQTAGTGSSAPACRLMQAQAGTQKLGCMH